MIGDSLFGIQRKQTNLLTSTLRCLSILREEASKSLYFYKEHLLSFECVPSMPIYSESIFLPLLCFSKYLYPNHLKSIGLHHMCVLII